MSLIVKEKSGTELLPIPEGLNLAVCYAIYDIGTQHNELFDIDSHKIIMAFEIPSERMQIIKNDESIDLPRAISKQFTLSLHKKSALRVFCESWRGKKFTEDELKGFDLFKLLGEPCQLNIIHQEKNGKIYANISTIVPAPKNTILKSENELKSFTFENNDFNFEEIRIPSWIVDLIKKSKEWKELNKKDDHYNENLPF